MLFLHVLFFFYVLLASQYYFVFIIYYLHVVCVLNDEEFEHVHHHDLILSFVYFINVLVFFFSSALVMLSNSFTHVSNLRSSGFFFVSLFFLISWATRTLLLLMTMNFVHLWLVKKLSYIYQNILKNRQWNALAISPDISKWKFAFVFHSHTQKLKQVPWEILIPVRI